MMSTGTKRQAPYKIRKSVMKMYYGKITHSMLSKFPFFNRRNGALAIDKLGEKSYIEIRHD